METQTSASYGDGNRSDDTYYGYLARLNARFRANVWDGAQPLFATNADGLWEVYLDSFTDPVERQYHNCHACRTFIERFGALVTIAQDGTTAPAVWHDDDAPPMYRPAVAALERIVRRAKVTGVFLCSDETWGKPQTGVWRHLHVSPPAAMVYARRGLLTAGQKMAERREDFLAVLRALKEFTLPQVETALTLLRSDALYRSEKLLGQAEWLHALHVARSAALGARRSHVVWRAVATAPAGFCHPRSGMIGTLLDDIAAGMEFPQVARRFAEKMHPLRYQRPQAAPTLGEIAEAEKVVQNLGIARSLARRFCRLDEVKALWRPAARQDATAPDGVFGHIKPQGAEVPIMRIPPQTMSWEKFQRTVLPGAERMQFAAPMIGNYTALVTAVHADAPPILQWDREDARNPVSWYFWHGGALAGQFGLRSGVFYDVEAIAHKPSMWNGGSEHHGAGVLFVIAGARETRNGGAALFPEILRADLHGVRSVIEAYSRSGSIEGADQPHAAGVMFNKGGPGWGATVRVWSGGRSLDYRLDRWD